MNTVEQKEYKKHGCIFVGNLVVINYTKEWKRNPNYDKFGGGAIFDALDEAKALLDREYPSANILLSIPELVARTGK